MVTVAQTKKALATARQIVSGAIVHEGELAQSLAALDAVEALALNACEDAPHAAVQHDEKKKLEVSG